MSITSPLKKSDLCQESRSAYDELPYESACCKYTHADYVYRSVVGEGYSAPDYKEARILELGCGLAGDLIAYALTYPSSKCEGIDLSSNQISAAKELADALELTNVHLYEQDLLDFKAADKEFDYIICHGVFSWTKETIRLKILSLCKELLAPNGFAVISYNALPGWHFASALRDALRFDTDGLEGKDKVSKARKFSHFLANHSYDEGHFRKAYKSFLQDEHAALLDLSDSYFFHDQLAEQNAAFYIKDFVNTAKKFDLKFAANPLPKTAELNEQCVSFLSKIEDKVMYEQYYDFITNRRFHISILTHAGHKPKSASNVNDDVFDHDQNITKENIGAKPKAFALARAQVMQNNEVKMVTSRNRESIKTTLLLNLIILYADGSRSVQEIALKLIPHARSGDITLKTGDGQQISDDDKLKEALLSVTEHNLALMACSALF